MIATLPKNAVSSTQKRRATRRALRRAFPSDPSLIVVDLFCGAGGTSTGFAKSKIAKVIACVNHDHKAINSHWANHPDVDHFTEDMRTLDLTGLVRLCMRARELHPNAKLILWASLECTNFSKAKGGMARDADSRTLADYLHRYIIALNPDFVMIENVVEFREWGPIQIMPKKKQPFPELYTELTIIKQKRLEWVTVKRKNGKETLRKKIIKVDAYGWMPIPQFKGIDFRRWCTEVCDRGYKMEWKEMNSADFGAYTSRNRLFGMFARPELPISWPEKTHAKKGVAAEDWAKAVRAGKKSGKAPLKKWKAVKHVLDFTNQGYTIFNRGSNMDIPIKQRKDLAEKTLERVYAGLIKFVAGGKDKFMAKTYAVASNTHGCYSCDCPAHTITTRDAQQVVQPCFLSTYNGGDDYSRNRPVTEPCRTLTTENRHAIVTCTGSPFLKKYYSGKPEGKSISVDGPAGTITCIDGQAIVQSEYIVQRNGGNPDGRVVDVNGPARTLTASAGNQDLVQPQFITKYHGDGGGQHGSIENPLATIACKDQYSIVQAESAFLDKYYSGDLNNQSINTPAGTIMPKDKHNLVSTIPFIDRQFSGGGQNSSIEAPAGSVMPVPKLNLVQAEPFIDNTHYSNTASSIDEPLRTITADRHYAYLVNPSWGGNPSEIEAPSPVIVARQDKAPMYLVVTEEGLLAIEIYESDSPCTKKIKQFMALYGIVDIKMRMLVVKELLQIQGFPKGYLLDGSQADQKKFIGNSVVPDVVEHWALAMHYDLTGELLKAAA
jgi:DNA (cytosine-5)-methyltransferase 1